MTWGKKIKKPFSGPPKQKYSEISDNLMKEIVLHPVTSLP